MDENKPRPIDFIFILMAICTFIALVALLGGGGGGGTYTNSTVHQSSQVNVLSYIDNSTTIQQIAPTPAPQFSTDSAGNVMCWNEPSHMYVYSPCPKVQP